MTALEPLPTESRDRTVRFGLIELDLLTTYACVPVPFPLQVPSFGRITAERDVLLATAGQTLWLRGLADENGPLDVAAELVTALREHRGTVDLVMASPDGPVGVVALVYRSWALICAQTLDDDPAGSVLIRRVPELELEEKLYSMVPRLGPVRSMPIRLPAQAVRTATRVIDNVRDDSEKERLLAELVRDNGGDPDMVNHLAGVLPTVHSRGQMGATRREGATSMRVGTELSWLDGPHGRLRISRESDGWVSINALRPKDFRADLDGLVGLARMPR